MTSNWTGLRSRFAALLLGLPLLGSCGTGLAPVHPPAREPAALTLLETSDLHGQTEPRKDPATQHPMGGLVALAAAIEHERQADPDGTLLLDAGDMLQGTTISNLSQGRAIVDFMNLMRFDVAAVGNHEFDWGVLVLRDRMRQARFPILLANMVEKQSGRAPPWAQPYAVVERRHVRIAVIGLITIDTPLVTLPERVKDYAFLPPAEVANRLIAELVPARADLAVLLCHIGAKPSAQGGEISGELVELAKAVHGAAAILGGHTHQAFTETIAGIPVVEPGDRGQYLGRVKLHVLLATGPAARPGQATVAVDGVEVLPVPSDGAPPEPAVTALIDRYEKETSAALDEVLGEAASPLERASRECPLGNLFADVMRAAAGADLAFQNPLGIRASLDAGPIRLRDVYNVMPFDNTLVVVSLTGAEVRALLEQATERAKFLHASGLRYAIDTARPPGSRVTFTSPFDEARTYRVAVNNFMAQGGDGLALLTKHTEAKDTGILLRDALADWIRAETRAGRKIEAKVEGRITQPAADVH